MNEISKILREAAGERLAKKQPRCADVFRGGADEIDRLSAEIVQKNAALREIRDSAVAYYNEHQIDGFDQIAELADAASEVETPSGS